MLAQTHTAGHAALPDRFSRVLVDRDLKTMTALLAQENPQPPAFRHRSIRHGTAVLLEERPESCTEDCTCRFPARVGIAYYAFEENRDVVGQELKSTVSVWQSNFAYDTQRTEGAWISVQNSSISR